MSYLSGADLLRLSWKKLAPSQLIFLPIAKSHDTKTKKNIKVSAQSNSDIVP